MPGHCGISDLRRTIAATPTAAPNTEKAAQVASVPNVPDPYPASWHPG